MPCGSAVPLTNESFSSSVIASISCCTRVSGGLAAAVDAVDSTGASAAPSSAHTMMAAARAACDVFIGTPLLLCRESGVEWLPTLCGPSRACSQRVEPGLHEAQTAFAAASRAPRTRDSLIGHGKQQPHYRCGEDLRAGVVRRQAELPGQAARDRLLGYVEQP